MMKFFKNMAWRSWYDFLASLYKTPELTFLNYGYVPGEKDAPFPNLESSETSKRNFMALYFQLFQRIDLEGLDVLEVCSGRGGGCAFIEKFFSPKSVTGIDLSEKNIAFCKETYQKDKLHFILGDAENLPVSSEAFDLVLNVEASHMFGSLADFLTEAKRVLRPFGFLGLCDIRWKNRVDEFHQTMHKSGFQVIEKKDITQNVIASLDEISGAREAFIDQHTPVFLRGLVRDFAAVKGSRLYNAFTSGNLIYVSYLLQKRNGGEGGI